ncbi:hypothetical protein ACN6AT_04850 [Streptomyces sp. JL4002]|uniref:hypothetical protein n=1 Tax=Streptomyces TaxID=1883 RepID=UPI0005E8132B|nr:hypothetical protein SF23_16805 [Streptomyces sp. MBRL 10]
MNDDSPSPLLRIVLRADSFATSAAGTVTLIAVLFGLVFTDTGAGIVAAVVLFAAWVAVGWTGRRHQRRGGSAELP